MAIDYLPGSKKLVSQIGSIVGFSGPGLLAKSTISHKTRACLEAYLTYLMVEHQLPLLHAKGLEQVSAFIQFIIIWTVKKNPRNCYRIFHRINYVYIEFQFLGFCSN